MSNNPFWDFSLQHYASESVQILCLQLQEQGCANVNLVLFSQWLALRGRCFNADLMAAHRELNDWHERVVVPLRRARNAIKKTDWQATQSLYDGVKRSELDAERVEQDMLFCHKEKFPLAPDQPLLQDLARCNLQAYLQTLSLTTDQVELFSAQIVAAVFK